MIGAEYFWCPKCKAYTIDTYTPDDVEDRCPICRSIRPDNARNLSYAVDPSKYVGKSYKVDDGKGARLFVDDRSSPYYVKVQSMDGKDKPKYLIMDDEGMFFALGDTPDPCDRTIAERVSRDPNLRFNDNGPVKIRYTKESSLVGSLNLKPVKKGRRKGRR